MDAKDIFNTGNAGTVSFEELQAAFKTPTQYQNTYEVPSPSDDLPPSLTNPNGEDLNIADPEAPDTVDPAKAMRTGERIARIIDTGIDFTLSNFVAHNNESYKADEKDLQDIAECWGEISQEHNWNIGPEMTLVFLYIMVYGPLVKQAVTDRRMAELEARQQMLEERMSAYEHRDAEPLTVKMNKNDAAATPHPSAFTSKPASPVSLDPSAE